ncbi:MAG: mannose-1-phosphate guanylyltransferase [Candidatus Caldatribacterium sp.]|uniref:mannose-1-phosphate guanylyltransferase n=1 Tax=Candidatus Caldatribacterium sp. TaxID=2282143 RepID=UPI00299CAEA7|nr:mannose-1-phosphate guanylyltransferase [Candidatus Caldatribacterium sp.]MCX7729710.1 mannose-1-phosphate guanylyltransferase [Candidatus Caldatribacterium sp.]MDW8080428.1 mannose-1-phosphate guanylyltransferase [Candidatus Calescibacterium sp.]
MPFAVIMAGGKGERLWPLSRGNRPKQFARLFGKSLLAHTVERILPLVGSERVYVVTQKVYAPLILQELPFLSPENLLLEPVGKNTAPCIGFAALFLSHFFSPQEIMIVLPADHVILDTERFRDSLELAIEVAESGDWLVTFGIVPNRPHTGYGYIRCGELFLEDPRGQVYYGAGFTEKPSQREAEEYLRLGGYLWNSGMFVWSARTILEALKRWAPEIAEGLARIAEVLGTPKEVKVLEEIFASFPVLSIDYAVMEKASNILVVSGTFGWNDVGSWESFSDLLPKDASGNTSLGECVALESTGCIFWTKKPVIAFGIDNVVLVEEEDLLFLMPRERDQEVRLLLQYLRERGQEKYL